MGLKDIVSKAVASHGANGSGFVLIEPTELHFKNPTDFEHALKEQEQSTVLIDADIMRRIDIDGRIDGTDYRISKAAFGDLCHFARIPASFIKLLAKADESQALDVVQTMLRAVFHSSSDKSLVLDTNTGRVDGIVGTDTYRHLPNKEAFDYMMSAAPGLSLSQGWLSGPNMRATAIIKTAPAEARKGDVVHFGVNLENSIHGDSALKVMEYIERLVCTNGAVCSEKGHVESVRHVGTISDNVIKAVLRCSTRAGRVLPIIQEAPHYILDVDTLDRVLKFIEDPANGGSEGTKKRFIEEAQQEAAKENRPPEVTSLWNWHNAVTAVAKEAPNVQRRVELESLGYRTLVKFGAHLVN